MPVKMELLLVYTMIGSASATCPLQRINPNKMSKRKVNAKCGNQERTKEGSALFFVIFFLSSGGSY